MIRSFLEYFAILSAGMITILAIAYGVSFLMLITAEQLGNPYLALLPLAIVMLAIGAAFLAWAERRP